MSPLRSGVKPDIDVRDKKKPTPKSTHRSMNFTPIKELNRITSSIIRKTDNFPGLVLTLEHPRIALLLSRLPLWSPLPLLSILWPLLRQKLEALAPPLPAVHHPPPSSVLVGDTNRGLPSDEVTYSRSSQSTRSTTDEEDCLHVARTKGWDMMLICSELIGSKYCEARTRGSSGWPFTCETLVLLGFV
ncbi:hypothetical protein Tsubulata_027464, partial [Turnera subulata]